MNKLTHTLVWGFLFSSMAQASDQVVGAEKKDAAVHAQANHSGADGEKFGPQSPRDLSQKTGQNTLFFTPAPSSRQMNLCNIHFHQNAEHKWGEFTTYAGDGDGHGYRTGYKYSGRLSPRQSKALDAQVCQGKHGGLQAGDTIEVHYVYSTAKISPGSTLAACVNEATSNPQLRVEAQVMVLVNDPQAANFLELTRVEQVNGFYQAPLRPENTGKPIQYAGSTTGAAYNEKASPLAVTWRVRPKVVKVDAQSVGKWCNGNEFMEDHAHSVRHLVVNEKMLAPIPSIAH
jgi:hypothetical protein